MKVLIVDDEFHIREGIKNSIPWERFEAELVLEAADGNSAWNLCERHAPDIILLDINIPGIDGIETAKRVRNRYKDTEIIFLTGYDEFQLMREAIILQASDYLLKPIAFGDLYHALTKAVSQIKSKKEQSQYINDLEKKVTDYGEVAFEQLLLDIVLQRRPLAEAVKMLQARGIALEGLYSLLRVEIDSFQQFSETVTPRDRQLYLYAYKKFAQEVSDLYGGGYALADSPGSMIVIQEHDQKDITTIESRMIEMAKHLREVYAQYLRVSISVGISSAAHSAEYMHMAYRQATSALEHTFLVGRGQIITYGSVQQTVSHKSNLLGKELHLLAEMRAGNDKAVTGILEGWSSELRCIPWSEARLAASQMVIFVMRMTHEAELDIHRDDAADPLNELNKCQSMDELIDFLSARFAQVGRSVRERKETPGMQIIEKAKQWIKNHLSDEASLNGLAQYLHISPNYLSSLFKQSTGETFQDYTSRLRFERAKELLMEPDRKIHEISAMVGFTDSNYFSIAFKKHVGLTPSQYRARYL
jgi:two-component system response regulator YesN